MELSIRGLHPSPKPKSSYVLDDPSREEIKQTGSNKELFDLTSNDCFVGDTILAVLVMMGMYDVRIKGAL